MHYAGTHFSRLLKSRFACFSCLGILLTLFCGATRAEEEIAEKKPDSAASHVLFVNVAGALDADTFEETVEYVQKHLNYPMKTAALDESVTAELAKRPAAQRERFGESAALVVLVERDPDGYAFLQAPRCWGMVNLHGLAADQPGAEILRDRLRKQFLKGLVYASGGGTNPDRRCAMWHKGLTPPEMDSTSATLSPYARFPLEDVLTELGIKSLASRPVWKRRQQKKNQQQ